MRLKVPPVVNQFMTKALDKNHAETLYKLLLKYRPEDKKQKRDRCGRVWRGRADGEGRRSEMGEGGLGGCMCAHSTASAHLRQAQRMHASKHVCACLRVRGACMPVRVRVCACAACMGATPACTHAAAHLHLQRHWHWRWQIRRPPAPAGPVCGSTFVCAAPTHSRRLKAEAEARAAGKETADKKKPVVVKYGINHITQLIESGKAQMVGVGCTCECVCARV